MSLVRARRRELLLSVGLAGRSQRALGKWRNQSSSSRRIATSSSSGQCGRQPAHAPCGNPAKVSRAVRWCSGTSFATLQGLTCIHFTAVNLAAVAAIAAGCPRITSLNLYGCERLTYAAVAAIAVGCPRITSLNLYGCERITDAAVAAVAANYLRRQHHRRGQSSQRAVKAARAGYSQLQIHILPAGARGILGPRVGVLWVRVSGVLSGESV